MHNMTKELIELVKKDASKPHSKLPEKTIYTIQDISVIEAINKRFENHETLYEIKEFEYISSIGLIPISFQFSSSSLITLQSKGILVLLDYNCKVVGIVDPFDIEQPNLLNPSSSESSEMPFVLSQTSKAKEFLMSSEDIELFERKNKEFFEPMGISFRLMNNGLLAETGSSTWTNGSSDDSGADDCGHQIY